MSRVCLVTGGAGFIGCAVSGPLAAVFDQVVVVDNLHPQVHPRSLRPEALDSRATLVKADVTDPRTWDEVLRSHPPAVVLHLAAETGTGQSLTEGTRHAMVNVVGLTRMLDALAGSKLFPEHVILTSSRAVYGEGEWEREDGTRFYPGQRDQQMLARGQWDFPGARALPFEAQRTMPQPTSVYGATKLAQEQILRAWSESFGVKTSVLRLQNVYGPGQSLSNPYTGVVTLFARLAREGKPIPLYEDGEMLRDFVYIQDVVQAIMLAIRRPPPRPRGLDIGSGAPITIRRAAQIIAEHHGAPAPFVSGRSRNGDVRHASCDVKRAQVELGYNASVAPDQGLILLCEWVTERVGI